MSNSQLKLSRNPSRSVVSDWEKRSAEDGTVIGVGGGKNSEMEGSKLNSKSAKGTGGCTGGLLDMMVVEEQEPTISHRHTDTNNVAPCLP